MTADYLLAVLPSLGFDPVGQAEPLAGGLLNHVWRVPTRQGSIIAKHAPGQAVGAALSPRRVLLEARALGLFEPTEPLADLAPETLRPPRPLAADSSNHLIVLEDVGDAPSLDAWLATADTEAAARAGRRIGTFLRDLHEHTNGDAALASDFDNADVQRVRSSVQYNAVGDWLRDFGRPDAEALGKSARALGRTFERPGACLTMGDMWPRSVLVLPGADLRIVDWEFAHYGRPAQDVGHLRAHAWMLAHTLGTPASLAFRKAFESACSPDGEEAELARRHAGCEVLIRTIGPFRDGYLYDGATSLQLERAVAQACAWLNDAA